jgi:hypothetical protein
VILSFASTSPKLVACRWWVPFHPILEPIFVELDGAYQDFSFQGENTVHFLNLLVSLVDRLIHVCVIQLASFPALELIVEWVEHLPPAKVVIGIQQSLFRLVLKRMSTFLARLTNTPVLTFEQLAIEVQLGIFGIKVFPHLEPVFS